MGQSTKIDPRPPAFVALRRATSPFQGEVKREQRVPHHSTSPGCG
jgi:hypothetical protein